jgi:hypothetical protein
MAGICAKETAGVDVLLHPLLRHPWESSRNTKRTVAAAVALVARRGSKHSRKLACQALIGSGFPGRPRRRRRSSPQRLVRSAPQGRRAPHPAPRSWKKSYTSFAVAALRPGVFSRSDRPALAMSLTGPKANRGALGARSNLRIKISGTIFRYHGANATSGSRQRRIHSWRWHMTAPDKVKYLLLVDCNGL